MNIKNMLVAVSALAASSVVALAQGPLYDKVIVDLPYCVTIGDRMLQPGSYVIQQNQTDGAGGSVLLIYSDKGRRFETSAMTIATLDTLTPRDTRVVLHRFGNDYFFDKIWVEGKNYGYEFPLPESVKARERERMKPVNLAARYVVMAPQQAQNVEPVPEPEAAPPSAEREEVPEAPPAPEPEPTPAPRKMPHTDAGWMAMLLSGGVLSAAGLALRRRR
jgi:hypothetical protein